jgi:hypothetical protein
MAPISVMMIEITAAKIGRSTKTCAKRMGWALPGRRRIG